MPLTPLLEDDGCPFDVLVPADPDRSAESSTAVDEALGDHDRYGLLPRYEWPGPE